MSDQFIWGGRLNVHSTLAGQKPTPPQLDRMPSVGHFPLVDLLRGFAAISVLTLHVIAHANWTAFPTRGPLAWFRDGALGVDLFFVISGFVISHSALGLFERRQFGFVLPYVKHRLFRILPLFYLTLIAFLLVQPQLIASGVFLDHLVSHLFFYFTFRDDTFSSINGPNWSVGIEMQFYLTIAILMPLLFRIRLNIAAIIAFALINILIAAAWRYWAASIIPYDDASLRDYRVFVAITQLPGHLDEFALGIIVAFFVRSPYFGLVRGNLLWYIVLGAALVPLFYLTLVLSHGIISAAFSNLARGAAYSVTFAVAVLLACSISSPLFIKATKWPRYLGVISYGIYLWHLPVILTLKKFGLSPPMMLLSTLSITISLAALSWHFFEAPLLKIGKSDRIPLSLASQRAAVSS